MKGARSFRFFALGVVCFLFLTVTGQEAQGQSNDTSTDQGTPSGGDNATDTYDIFNDTESTTTSDAGNETSPFVTDDPVTTTNETDTTGDIDATPIDDFASDNTTSEDVTDDQGAATNETDYTMGDEDVTPSDDLSSDNATDTDTIWSDSDVTANDTEGDNTTFSGLVFTPGSDMNETEEAGTTDDPGLSGTIPEETDFTNDTVLDDGTQDADNATATDDDLLEPSTVTIDDESGTLGDVDVVEDADNATEPSTVEIIDESGSMMDNDTDMTSDNATYVTPFDYDVMGDYNATDDYASPDNETDTTTATVDEDTDFYNETTDAPADDDNTTMTSPDYVTEPENATADGLNATEVIPVDTDTASEQTIVQRKPEKADFVVYDNNGNPCLLASINITIWFKYHIQEGLVRETYTVSQRDEKDDSTHVGHCEDTVSYLSITWNNNTFTLNLTFALEERAVEERTKEDGLEMDVLPEGVNSSSSWSLHQVALTYDTTNEQFFPGASNPSVKTVDPATVNLFKTPLGLSYLCETPGAVKLQFKDVEMVFNYVRLEPFGPQSNYFANETVECSGDMKNMPLTDESTTVPLVVAACLAAAVIVIIIGYAIHRCLTRHRHGEYKAMD